jgi:protein O-mannosyl-transferase
MSPAEDCFNVQGRRRKRTIYVLTFCMIAGLSLGVYANSLQNSFVNWDDPGLILNNLKIRGLGSQNVKDMFIPKRASTFQPIRVLSYAIDYRVWGFNPTGFRITNLIFYALTCILVFLALQCLSRHLRAKAPQDSHFRIALFGALLFAVHPVHVEAVTWLAARKEVLQGCFFFSSFYLYLRGREECGRKQMVYLGGALFSILLAILSKPSAVVFPGVVIVYEISENRERIMNYLRRHWLFISISLVLSIIFSCILMKIMFEAGGIKAYHGKGFFNNVLVCVYVFVRSIKLIFLTINYSAAYSFPITLPTFHVKNIAFMAITVSLFGFSIASLRWTKVVFVSFFFFVVTLLPYLNIIPISTLLADRYVFIASFAGSFILGILFDRLYRYKRKELSEGFFKPLSMAVFLLLLVGYSFMTIQQNKVWENSYTLWADAVEKNPESNIANALMGVVYMDLGMNKEALKYLERAVEILPYDYQSRNNLGIVFGRLGEPEKALRELLTAMSLRPDDDSIKINLAVEYQREKEFKKAKEVLEHLLAKSNHNANLHFRLGLIYKEMGQYDQAISELTKSMELAPGIINSYEELGNLYSSKLRDPEKAKYYYKRGIEMAPKAKAKVEELRWMIQDLER